ncbi:MAG: hypothetical protein U9Q63_01510 [Patescibacteria group bacterium]|nr:hypothetical protein [Patescibacteria group bacterium]
MNNLPNDPISLKFRGASKKKKKTKVSSSSGLSKERVEGRQEVTPITEYTRKVDLEPEVESWLEKIEKEDSQLKQAIVNPADSTNAKAGQVVLDNIQPSKFKVVLPLTKEEVERGLHSKVIDSVRWLAEWCIKTIKMFHGKVAYRKHSGTVTQ